MATYWKQGHGGGAINSIPSLGRVSVLLQECTLPLGSRYRRTKMISAATQPRKIDFIPGDVTAMIQCKSRHITYSFPGRKFDQDHAAKRKKNNY
jgi:hypothetical protein